MLVLADLCSGRRAASLAALGCTVVLALAACGGGGKPSSGSADAPTLVSTAGTAQGSVDLVTWNLTTGEPDTLDPPNAATYGGGQVVMNLCDTLLRYDANYNMSPGLAVFKQVSPTRLVYTLRGGAKFWDGTPVTAEDVAYSLQRAKGDTIVSTFFSNVSSIAVTGPNEVTVDFSTPDERFNNEMTTIAGVVMQKAFTEKAGKDVGTAAGGLMCSGPFRLDQWRTGDSITMSRNDAYWDRDRLPHAKTVKFTFISDATALTQALNAGEIDGAYEIPAAAIPNLQNSSVGKVYFGHSTSGIFLAAAKPGGPTADQKFGDALQKLLNRDELAQAVFHGSGEPLYTVVTPRTWPNDQTDKYKTAYAEVQKVRTFDLEAAKTLVKDSSYDGRELVIAYQAGDPTMNQVAQLVQQEAQTAGIKIKLQTMEALAYEQAQYDATKRQGIDFMLGSSFNSVADPLEPALFDFTPGAPYNYIDYNDAETAKLLNEALGTFDGAARADLIIEAQKRWEKVNGTVPVVATHTVTFLNNRLAGAVTSFAYWVMPQMAFVGAASPS